MEITPEALDIALKIQHRNTRHDAIDTIQEIRSKYLEKGFRFTVSADDMFNEMVGSIMNLKQRKPDES